MRLAPGKIDSSACNARLARGRVGPDIPARAGIVVAADVPGERWARRPLEGLARSGAARLRRRGEARGLGSGEAARGRRYGFPRVPWARAGSGE